VPSNKVCVAGRETDCVQESVPDAHIVGPETAAGGSYYCNTVCTGTA
jgi:hypothetical protein